MFQIDAEILKQKKRDYYYANRAEILEKQKHWRRGKKSDAAYVKAQRERHAAKRKQHRLRMQTDPAYREKFLKWQKEYHKNRKADPAVREKYRQWEKARTERRKLLRNKLRNENTPEAQKLRNELKRQKRNEVEKLRRESERRKLLQALAAGAAFCGTDPAGD